MLFGIFHQICKLFLTGIPLRPTYLWHGLCVAMVCGYGGRFLLWGFDCQVAHHLARNPPGWRKRKKESPLDARKADTLTGRPCAPQC